jgi:hypothetical protein
LTGILSRHMFVAMIRVSLLVAMLGFFGCLMHPAHNDPMRDRANQLAAQCKQDPNQPMCKQQHVSCASGQAEVAVGSESWCEYSYFNEQVAPSAWDSVLKGNSNCYPFGAKLKSCNGERCTNYVVAETPSQKFEGCPQ